MLRIHQSSGFTLIEVLVTVVIMSIGMLGLAGLQFTGIRGQQQAYEHTLVVAQAWDMADRIKSNPTGVAAGKYDDLEGSGSDPGCINSTAGCTTDQLATYDHYIWAKNNSDVLPDAEGVVCRDTDYANDFTTNVGQLSSCDNLGDALVVKIWWDHDLNPKTPKAYFAMSTRP